MASKRAELEPLWARAAELEVAAEAAAPARDFRAALARPERVALIAECKRRSPGAGEIRPDLDPVASSSRYERAGAAALSVLTDADYFGGSNADLRAVKAATELPVLRKDFTLDPVHVVEARAAGADAVLLIVRILSDHVLTRLHREASALGMASLVEVHDRDELERAAALGAAIVGINNRDLATFRSDLCTTLDLLEHVPEGVIVVSESGIRDAEDVIRLGDAGVDAVLVGEALLRAADMEGAARAMSAVERRAGVRG